MTGITAMLQQAKDVPMLDMFGGENWTPNANHPGVFKRAGINHWAIYKWDPEREGPRRARRQLRREPRISFDDVLCGSPFGRRRRADRTHAESVIMSTTKTT